MNKTLMERNKCKLPNNITLGKTKTCKIEAQYVTSKHKAKNICGSRST